MKITKIAIIGNGNIGQAIFYLLNEKKQKYFIDIYDKAQIKNKNRKTLSECISGAQFVFLCIPSWCTNDALREIKPYLNKNAILISLAKGLDKNTKESIDKLIEKNTKNDYALLSGPMFATEIKENKMSFAVLASQNKLVYKKVSELFRDTKLKLEYSKDVHAVAISAILKNIYALLFGIIENYGDGNNTKGFLTYQTLKEMKMIMKTLKLAENTTLGISGLGDFVATSSSIHSQNIKAGKEIFENGNASIKSEGLVSLAPLLHKLGKKSKTLPLLSLLERILIQKKDAQKEIEKFFANLN